jgi:hypothetical protein
VQLATKYLEDILVLFNCPLCSTIVRKRDNQNVRKCRISTVNLMKNWITFTQNLPGSMYRSILCLNLAELCRNTFLHGLLYCLLLALSIDGSGFKNLYVWNKGSVWRLSCLSYSFSLCQTLEDLALQRSTCLMVWRVLGVFTLKNRFPHYFERKDLLHCKH